MEFDRNSHISEINHPKELIKIGHEKKAAKRLYMNKGLLKKPILAAKL